MKVREQLSRISEDKLSTDNEDVSVGITSMPVESMEDVKLFTPKPVYATKKKKPTMTTKQNVRRQTVSSLSTMLTLAASFNKYGLGTVASSNVGNIKNSEYSRKPHTFVLISSTSTFTRDHMLDCS